MSTIPYDPPNSNQPNLIYFSSNNPELLESWSKTNNDIYNTTLGNVSIGSTNNTIYKLNINGDLNAVSINGIGSNINNLDYNKITLNKPTNFQSDWNSTIINKPSIYNQTEVNNLLSAKENTLTFNSPLNKSSSTVTIDLSSKENVLTFSTPLTRTTNTIGIDLSSYPSYTVLNNCNFDTITLRNTTLNSYPTYTVLNNCNFDTITLRNTTLNNYPTYAVLASSNYITNATSGLTNYSTTSNDPNYVLKSGSTMTGKLITPNITLGSDGKINSADDYHYIQISQPTDTLTIQEWGKIVFSIGQSKTEIGRINSSGLTVTGSINATSFTGYGSNISNVSYANIIGKPTNFQSDWTTTVINKPTNFQSDWTTTIINKPTNFQSDWTTTVINRPDIYTKTEVNGLSTLTNYPTYAVLASSNYITNATSGLTNYSTTSNDPNYVLKSGSTMTGKLITPNITLGSDGKINSYDDYHYIQISQPTDTLTIQEYGKIVFSIGQSKTEIGRINISGLTVTGSINATSFIGYGSNISNVSYANIIGKPDIYTKTEVNGLSTLTNFYNKTDSDERFLQLSGGTVTGQLVLSLANNPLQIKSTTTNANNCIRILNDINKTAYIGVAGSTFGGNYQNNLFIESATGSIILNSTGRVSTSVPNLIIDTAGNIGIGVLNPSSKLDVNGTSYFNDTLTVGSAVAPNQKYAYFGGLRIGGFDGNTLYNENRDIGLTVNSTKTIYFVMWTGNGIIMDIKNTSVNVYQRLYVNSGDNSYTTYGGNANGYYLKVGSTSSASSTMYDATSSGVWTSSTGALHLNPSTASNTVYINFFNTSGLLSVGGAIPSAKLHVGSGTASTGNILQKYYSVVLNDQSLIYQTLSDVCAIFESSVWCKSKYSVSSDIRIKKNIQDINDDSALQKILLIEPKTYEYIDKVERGNSTVYGFIAQQIKEVIPEAITIEKSVVPNIFKICNYNNDIISIPEEDISKLKVNDEIEIIIEDDNNKRLCKIIEINDDNTIKINENLSETEVVKECFVYGSKVDDFHTLDKNYIYTLNVCATQELYKIIQQLQERISVLESRLN